MAQHALILGPSGHVKPNPFMPNLLTKPFNQTPHRNRASLNLHAWLSKIKASLRQWQHELRLLKESQSDKSIRQSEPFLQSGITVIRWTSPPMVIANCQLYLFQDRKLQPRIIDGYRSAIADKLGNSPINVSKDENLARISDCFHRQTQESQGFPS